MELWRGRRLRFFVSATVIEKATSGQHPLTLGRFNGSKRKISDQTDPKRNLEFLDVSHALSSLARLTLRQLRQMASDLGVTLYSRKSKETLGFRDWLRQRAQELEADRRPSRLSVARPSQRNDRVVFLPRDPQWAYVFWEISDKIARWHK